MQLQELSYKVGRCHLKTINDFYVTSEENINKPLCDHYVCQTL